MNSRTDLPLPRVAPTTDGWVRRLGPRAGDLLPIGDFLILLGVGQSCLALLAQGDVGLPGTADGSALANLSWTACLMGPFLLYDGRFAELALAGERSAWHRRFARRAMLFGGVMLVIAFAGRWLSLAPLAGVGGWLGATALLGFSLRSALDRHLRSTDANASAGLEREDASVPASTPRPALPSAHIGDWHPIRLLADRPIRGWNAVLKTASDRLLGLMITLALLPILALVALAIRLESPGPILFRQRRHGYCNSEFDIYKFRSMRVATEVAGGALAQTVRGDQRITRVGRFIRKWSLDELPQLFNVLRGDMSLVGPRPHAVNMRTQDRLGTEIIASYPHRHRVKPGITGWAQVNGARGATDTPEQLRRRIDLDLHYVNHWSLALDLSVLLRTIKAVLRPTNAF